MQILVLLGMYFDAVVVEVKKNLLFIQIGSGHTVKMKLFLYITLNFLLLYLIKMDLLVTLYIS